MAVFAAPVVLLISPWKPKEVFPVPSVLPLRPLKPNAEFPKPPVLFTKASVPKVVLKLLLPAPLPNLRPCTYISSLKDLAPAKLWLAVVIMPGFVASAGVKPNTPEFKTKPLASELAPTAPIEMVASLPGKPCGPTGPSGPVSPVSPLSPFGPGAPAAPASP